MERALAGLLNAASAGEEARGSLFTRIQECAVLSYRAPKAKAASSVYICCIFRVSSRVYIPKSHHEP